MKERIYCCIDLKSFFASVECVERGLDPFAVNLVVADPDRDRGTICLAVTPAMKALGVRNRCRVFEIPPHISYIMAKPRMRLYVQKSEQIRKIYGQYLCDDDVYAYSIDECFLDITDYVKLYGKAPIELARFLLDEIWRQTGLTAASGVGTNLFLAKVALDIEAKHAKDGIGFLDEARFRERMWHHRPITDIRNVGQGTAKRLARFGIYDLYGVAHTDPALLYREFGVNAEYLIDHAHGREPCTIADIRAYVPRTTSLSRSQILFEDYTASDARLIVREMADALCLELVEKGMATDSISLTVGYSKDMARPSAATRRLSECTNSQKRLVQAFEELYEEIVRPSYPVRRIGIGLLNLVSEENVTISFFTDTEADEREQELLHTVIDLHHKYGKNAVLKGMSLQKKATARERNRMIGGHNGE